MKYVFLTLFVSFVCAKASATEYSCIQTFDDGAVHAHDLVISRSSDAPDILLDGFPLLENTTGFKKTCKGTYWLQAPEGFARYTAVFQSPSDTAFYCTVEEDVLIEQTLIDGKTGSIQFLEDDKIGPAVPCTFLN